MKSFLIFGCMVAMTVAQRPSYAGTSQKVYPELASRFKDTASSGSSSSFSSSFPSWSSSSPSNTDSTDTNTIVNRLGETDPQTTIRIPVDARGDEELVKWLNTWPRENRPFWLLNAEHIEKFRDPEGTRNKQKQQEVLSRSVFGNGPEDTESRPIRPAFQRPSFLSALGRK